MTLLLLRGTSPLLALLLVGCNTPSTGMAKIPRSSSDKRIASGGEISTLKTIYETYSREWEPPSKTLPRQGVIIAASVMIAKDGRVLSARITKSSGDAEIDRSVQQVLDRVRQVPPPEMATTNHSEQFPLEIIFNLRSKVMGLDWPPKEPKSKVTR